jgi:hypothetical protein
MTPKSRPFKGGFFMLLPKVVMDRDHETVAVVQTLIDGTH